MQASLFEICYQDTFYRYNLKWNFLTVNGFAIFFCAISRKKNLDNRKNIHIYFKEIFTKSYPNNAQHFQLPQSLLRR